MNTRADLNLDDTIVSAARSIDQAAETIGTASPGQPAGAPAPSSPAAAPAGPDFNADAKELVTFAAELYFPLWPRLEQVWTPEKREQLSTRLGAVMKKWNISMEALLGKWGPEIMLAVAVVPAVVPTYKAIKQDNADAKTKAELERRAAPPAGKPEAAPPPSSPPNSATSSATAPVTSQAPIDTLKLHEKV